MIADEGRLATLLAPLLARRDVAAVMAALNGEGEEARLVGGAVRNALIGEPVADIDIATTALPDETMRRAQAAGFRTVPTGIAHGTVTVLASGVAFEVTTLRRDIETDGRHAVVSFGRDFEADALRRDFTMNALALDLAGRVHDYAGGLADLAARRVRFIGDAGSRIAEDYLRILRFFRFHARYGTGEADPAAVSACIRGRAGLDGLSRERVRAELMKLLVAPGAAATLQVMAGAGLLMPIIGAVPQLSRFASVADGGGEGVYPAFRLAALAVCVREDAVRLRERLRLSNEEFDRIERVAIALEALGGRGVPVAVTQARHLAQRVGSDAVAAALVLLAANAGEAVRAGARDLTLALGRTPRFVPSGRDVLAIGVPAGPQVGHVLEQSRHAWIEAGCPEAEAEQMAFVVSASGV